MLAEMIRTFTRYPSSLSRGRVARGGTQRQQQPQTVLVGCPVRHTRRVTLAAHRCPARAGAARPQAVRGRAVPAARGQPGMGAAAAVVRLRPDLLAPPGCADA